MVFFLDTLGLIHVKTMIFTSEILYFLKKKSLHFPTSYYQRLSLFKKISPSSFPNFPRCQLSLPTQTSQKVPTYFINRQILPHFFQLFKCPRPRPRSVLVGSPCPKASAKSRRPSGVAKATAGGGKGRRWKLRGNGATAMASRPGAKNGRENTVKATTSWIKTRCQLEAADGI